jgi:translation initiation factor IF-2
MSTKDLIERLNRTQTTTRRAAKPEGESEGPVDSTGRGVTTRVGARVIRRRKNTEPVAPPTPVSLPAAAVAKPAAAKAAAPKTEVIADAPTTTVDETAPVAVAESAPAESQEATPKVVAKPAAEAATETAAKPAAEAAAEAATEAATETAAKPAAETAETEDAAGRASKLASGLPRADGTPGRRLPRLGGNRPPPRKPAFAGLGSAVVKPPPGYDPNDPDAARKVNEAAREGERQKKWQNENPTAPATGEREKGAADDRKTTNKPRRQEHRRTRVEMYMDDIPAAHRRRRRSRRNAGPKKTSPLAKAIKRRVEVDGTITVAALAHGMSVKTGTLIKKLIGMGQMATVNDELDIETAQLIAEEFQYDIVNTTFSEDDHMITTEDVEADEDLQVRAPIVTIMGHVDHGKTTLLDTIRRANVADGEAGGITQHTAAYQVEHEGQNITFIDTPGHAAFTEMRSRGAQVTDIVVLVVAADDGIMPQTIEAINHSKAAGVQILVAVNKCDKPGVDPTQARQALMEHGLVPEEYGGDTIMCNVSALKGDGLDALLANIAVLAEVAEYNANPDRHAEGTVLEARIEKGRGPVATLLVQNGTLKQGDTVVLGTVWGRVRAMNDYNGTIIKQAGPSSPVEIIGIQDVPNAGDNFVVVESDKAARSLAENRLDIEKRKAQTGRKSVSLEDLLAQASEGEKVQLNLIIKADVNGTLEAIKSSFDQINVEGANVKFLHAAVGGVTESDVTLAQTYGAVIIGFNVRPDSKARHLADEYAIQIRTYSVIYEAIEDVEAAMKGLLSPTFREIVQGTADIRECFQVPKIGTVAGVRVQEGKIARSHQVRLLRDGVILWTGKLASLRRFKDDVREVEKGYECGMNLEGFNDLKVGDILETFIEEEVRLA